MSTTTRSAFGLTAIYVAVHLINACIADAAAIDGIRQDANGQIAIEPKLREVDTLRVDADWFIGKRCQVQTDRIAIILGDQTLRIPKKDVADLTIDARIVESENSLGLVKIPTSAGCSENPIRASNVTVRTESALLGSLMLWENTSRHAEIVRVERDLNRARRQPECSDLDGLRYCTLTVLGTETVRAAFPQTGAKMPSGVPLHALCKSSEPGSVCEITESQTSTVGYRAFLKRLVQASDLTNAESEIQQKLGQYAVKKHVIEANADTEF